MSQSQNKMISGPTYSGSIDISPATALYNLPTVTVLRSEKLSLPISTSCINIIGNFNVVIPASSSVSGQTLLIVATGGVPASVSLDNGGTIAGVTSYVVTPGDFLLLSFDGTNLTLLSHTGFQF